MQNKYTLEELLHKAASYCSISERCISEVEAKLTIWDVAPEDRKEIIVRLQKDDFINEQRFCNAFVKDKFRFNKWGKIKISLALSAKELDKTLINKAISLIDEGEYEEMLASILKKKLQSISYSYEYEKQGKLFLFAQSKGFEAAIIEKVIRRITLSP
ncbi:MAG: RecX family transcriptional regulator [Prevotellaceae bacterium]|jgi:regulatory protein|nr:RecX family transcriptional regulator [Prevotellaceae bacterium]